MSTSLPANPSELEAAIVRSVSILNGLWSEVLSSIPDVKKLSPSPFYIADLWGKVESFKEVTKSLGEGPEKAARLEVVASLGAGILSELSNIVAVIGKHQPGDDFWELVGLLKQPSAGGSGTAEFLKSLN